MPEMRQQQMETAAIGINVNKYQIATGTIAPAPRRKNVTVSRRVYRISRRALDYLQGTAIGTRSTYSYITLWRS